MKRSQAMKVTHHNSRKINKYINKIPVISSAQKDSPLSDKGVDLTRSQLVWHFSTSYER